MNNRLTIQKKLTNNITETLLEELEQAHEELDLEIPADIDYRGFGIVPSLYLLVFTWLRTKKGNLIVSLDKDNKEAIKNFVTSYYGYIIICTVWKDCEIVNQQGESLKKALRLYTVDMARRIDFLDDLPNSEIAIPLFDHYPKDKGLSHWFYNSEYKFAIAPTELDNSTYRIIEYFGRIHKAKLTQHIKETLDTIQRILWELIGNTHEHATKDYLDQILLSPNTRGLYMKMHQSSKGNFVKANVNEPAFSAYFERALQDKVTLVLEITIFDSGPGLVKRFLGESWKPTISIDQEVDTIKKCLHRGASSVKNIANMNKGYGLDDVLQLLSTKRGFLKIRTGHANIFRDLVQAPYITTEHPEQVELFDITSRQNNVFTRNASAEGTQITMAYPLT